MFMNENIFSVNTFILCFAGSDSAVCIKLQSLTLRCASNCGVGLFGVHQTAESDSVVLDPYSGGFLFPIRIPNTDPYPHRNSVGYSLR